MNASFLMALKILGISVFIMVLNVGFSILEVFIYAQIVPSKPRAFYDAHALQSAPLVAGIGGYVLMFLFTRWYMIKNSNGQLLYALALPSIYIVLDLSILIFVHVNFGENLLTLLIVALAKYTGSLSAYFMLIARNNKK